MTEPAEMVRALRASLMSELSWIESGLLQVRGVVALTRGDRPAIAFTYADEGTARSVAAASSVVLSTTDSRSTGSTFRPLVMTGRPRLVEDPSGELFVEELLTEELRRYPPSRVYADSPLLRREHWWYLPRLVVELDVGSVQPVAERADPKAHLLVVAGPSGPVVRVARVDDAASAPDRLALDVSGAVPSAGAAVLFGQDASLPDMEQWDQWRFRGTWDGTAFAVHEAPEWVGLAPMPTVMQRWRRQRDLQKRCRRAIPAS